MRIAHLSSILEKPHDEIVAAFDRSHRLEINRLARLHREISEAVVCSSVRERNDGIVGVEVVVVVHLCRDLLDLCVRAVEPDGLELDEDADDELKEDGPGGHRPKLRR